MQTQERIYSPEEYLALEETADFRSEYYNGQIFSIASGSLNHNRIGGNLVAALNLFLTDDYDVFTSNMRLWVPQAGLYTYPDVLVVAGALEFAEGRKDTITNPKLIVEVLSDSTKNYDRGEKFEFYRTIASFQEYLLVDQAKIHLEHYTKTAHNQWLLTDYNDLDAELTCVAIPFRISLSAIYKKVIF